MEGATVAKVALRLRTAWEFWSSSTCFEERMTSTDIKLYSILVEVTALETYNLSCQMD